MEKLLNLFEWNKITDEIVKFADSSLGKKEAQHLKFYSDIDEINFHQLLTTEAKFIVNKQISYPSFVVFDISDYLSRVKLSNSLEADEILEVAFSIKTSGLLKSFFSRNSEIAPKFAELTENLYENRKLEDEILSKFDNEFQIKDDASPELKSLRLSLKDNQFNQKNILNSMLKKLSSYLQESVYTLRDNRYVFPVKIEHKAHVKGIIHDVSTSGATIFVEPEAVVEISNKIVEIEKKIEAEIRRILYALSMQIAPEASLIEESIPVLSLVDLSFAKAKYSLKIDGVQPVLNDERYVQIKGMKHPVLLEILDEVVPNDIEIGKTFNTLVITGSNTGGKTVVLKTLAICILMAKAGLHIPAFEADIYPFENIYADIGDDQSLTQSLSTFSSHMSNIIKILNNVNDKSLVLFDELGAGTDPSEGAALAESILEFLKNKDNGVRTVITTHFGELKSLKYLKEGFENAAVQFDIRTFKPNYKLIIGIPGKSNAITISENLGLAKNITERAKEIYHTQKDATGEIMEGLQNTHIELSEQVKTIKSKKESLESLESEYTEKLEELTESKKKTINIYKKKYDSELLKAKDEIKSLLAEIKRTKSEKIAKRAMNRVSEIENSMRSGINSDFDELQPDYLPLDPSEMKIGDEVYVKDLSKNAFLLTLPDSKNRVQIQVGELKTTLKLSKLFKPLKTTQKVEVYKPKKGITFKRANVPTTLDIRGYRVEDALDALDKYLDDASLAGLLQVTIIHGHGTGALRSAVRDYLSDSPYVQKFRPGGDSEGSDGVSIVDIV